MPLSTNLVLAVTFIDTLKSNNENDFASLLQAPNSPYQAFTNKGYAGSDLTIRETAYTASMNVFDFVSIIGPILANENLLITTIQKLIDYEITNTAADPKQFMATNGCLSKALLAYFLHLERSASKNETHEYAEEKNELNQQITEEPARPLSPLALHFEDQLIIAVARSKQNMTDREKNDAIRTLYSTIQFNTSNYQCFLNKNTYDDTRDIKSLESLKKYTDAVCAQKDAQDKLMQQSIQGTIDVMLEHLNSIPTQSASASFLSLFSFQKKKDPTQNLRTQVINLLEDAKKTDPKIDTIENICRLLSDTTEAELDPVLTVALELFLNFKEKNSTEQINTLNDFIAYCLGQKDHIFTQKISQDMLTLIQEATSTTLEYLNNMPARDNTIEQIIKLLEIAKNNDPQINTLERIRVLASRQTEEKPDPVLTLAQQLFLNFEEKNSEEQINALNDFIAYCVDALTTVKSVHDFNRK